jgi:hypothetical protein
VIFGDFGKSSPNRVTRRIFLRTYLRGLPFANFFRRTTIMLAGQNVWRAAMRKVWHSLQLGHRNGRPRTRREAFAFPDFSRAAEVVEERTLLSGPTFAQGIDSHFQDYGGATGTAYVNGGIASDSSGNVYVNGVYAGTGNINPLGTAYTLATSNTNSVPFVAKYDSNLNLQWAVDPALYSTTNLGSNNVFQHILVSPVSDDVFVGGSLSGTMTLPTAQGTLTVSGNSGFLMRLDPSNGNVLWFAKVNMGPPGATVVDASGNLYLTSNANKTPTSLWTYIYGPGTGGNPITYQPSLSGIGETYLVKIDSNGNVVWSGNFSTTNTKSSGSLVGDPTVDGAGNLYFNMGLTSGTVDVDPSSGVKTISAVTSNDNVLVKIDTNGHLVWVNQNTKAACGGGALVMDQNGNLDAIFGTKYPVSVTVTGKGKNQVTTVTGGNVCQFDTNGNLIWYKTDQSMSSYNFIAWDPAGNLNFYGSNATSELTRYSLATDSVVWSVPRNGYRVTAFSIDAFGNIWTAGVGEDNSITTVNVSPTSTPIYYDWETGPGGAYGVWMLVKWTQPGGLAAPAQSGGTTQALSSSLVVTPTSSAPVTQSQQPALFVGDMPATVSIPVTEEPQPSPLELWIGDRKLLMAL